MNRRYRRDFFRELIQKINAQVRDFILTTDVMIGFPGESYDQFENTVQLLSETQPYKLHVFPYSRREGTRAAHFSEFIDGKEMNRRREILPSREEEWRRNIQVPYLGKKLNVLTEEGNCEEGWVTGRTQNYVKVRFPGKRIPGLNYQIEITDIDGVDLIGWVADTGIALPRK